MKKSQEEGAQQRPRGDISRVLLLKTFRGLLDVIFVLPLFFLAVLARFFPKPVEVGLGPLPLINAVYHKQALEKFGHSAEIFVDRLWYDIPYDYSPMLLSKGPARFLAPYWLTARCFFRYSTLYTYFEGGSLHSTTFLCYLEPALLRLANVRTVIMGYGADVFTGSRSPDPFYVHAMGRCYPQLRFLHRRTVRKIDLWVNWADHTIAGVDWVYHLHYWDTLTLAHFAIDSDRVKAPDAKPETHDAPLRIVHAPNHRELKGTEFLLKAVEELKAENIQIELTLLEGVPNEQVHKAIVEADLVVDQLVIGWYAMFAIEAMALSTPCICYIDPVLKKLYWRAGLLKEDEPPLISSTPETIKQTLRQLAGDRNRLTVAGKAGRDYVERNHSLQAIGKIFDRIQKEIGVL